MTPERIAELRRIEQAGTPGEWDAIGNMLYVGRVVVPMLGMVSDVALIAATRNALPELLDEIERLNARLKEVGVEPTNPTAITPEGLAYAGGPP